MSLMKLISDFEDSFSTKAAIEYTNVHAEIPVFAVTVYLAVRNNLTAQHSGGLQPTKRQAKFLS